MNFNKEILSFVLTIICLAVNAHPGIGSGFENIKEPKLDNIVPNAKEYQCTGKGCPSSSFDMKKHVFALANGDIQCDRIKCPPETDRCHFWKVYNENNSTEYRGNRCFSKDNKVVAANITCLPGPYFSQDVNFVYNGQNYTYLYIKPRKQSVADTESISSLVAPEIDANNHYLPKFTNESEVYVPLFPQKGNDQCFGRICPNFYIEDAKQEGVFLKCKGEILCDQIKCPVGTHRCHFLKHYNEENSTEERTNICYTHNLTELNKNITSLPTKNAVKDMDFFFELLPEGGGKYWINVKTIENN